MQKVIAALLLIALTGIGLATGQVAEEVKPIDYQDGSSCDAKATKHLMAATDPNQRDWQEWNLNAAKAYRELAAQGFREC